MAVFDSDVVGAQIGADSQSVVGCARGLGGGGIVRTENEKNKPGYPACCFVDACSVPEDFLFSAPSSLPSRASHPLAFFYFSRAGGLFNPREDFVYQHLFFSGGAHLLLWRLSSFPQFGFWTGGTR